jgi:hypothetical protein
LLTMIALSSLGAYGADQPSEKPQTVTIDMAGQKVSAVAEKICKETGVRILLEKTADVEVSLAVADMPVEDALTAVCKPVKLSWRKVYIRADSPLLKQPEALASNLRLMEGLAFPEVVVDKGPDCVVYSKQRRAVDSVSVGARKDLGMVPLYLITNDEEANKVDGKLESRLAKYRKLEEEQMKLLREMTPEEREQAIEISAQFVQKADSGLLADMTKTALRNPNMMTQMYQYGLDQLFSMNPEDRRAMVRLNYMTDKLLTPEQKAVLAEDWKAIAAEMEGH